MVTHDPADEGRSSADGASPTEVGQAERNMAKTVLQKIDRTLIPLLFVTYMFNFMDKIILSSAAVFGLREDNV